MLDAGGGGVVKTKSAKPKPTPYAMGSGSGGAAGSRSSSCGTGSGPYTCGVQVAQKYNKGGRSLASLLGGGLETLGRWSTGVADWTGDRANDAWDRGSTTAIYAWDTSRRRLRKPIQTLKDFTQSGPPGVALFAEDFTAIGSITVDDAELKRDGSYCGREAACLIDAWALPGRDRLAVGHTILFEDGLDPEPALVAHEMQHVYDFENLGGLVFYGSYLLEGAINLAAGDSWDEAYHDISWERRAYTIEDNYPRIQPRGWPW